MTRPPNELGTRPGPRTTQGITGFLGSITGRRSSASGTGNGSLRGRRVFAAVPWTQARRMVFGEIGQEVNGGINPKL